MAEMTEQEMSNKRDYNDSELMDLYISSSELIRKDRQGGGRVDSWAWINGIMHVGISGDPSKWSAEGLRLYWEHVDGRPCGGEGAAVAQTNIRLETLVDAEGYRDRTSESYEEVSE